ETKIEPNVNRSHSGPGRRYRMEPSSTQRLGSAGNVPVVGQPLTRKPLIEASNVEKNYGATRVLRGVSFQVRADEIHALLGGNGAGKSTLIRIVTGLISRDAGEIGFASSKAGHTSPIIAVVHQELALLPELSVGKHRHCACEVGLVADQPSLHAGNRVWCATPDRPRDRRRDHRSAGSQIVPPRRPDRRDRPRTFDRSGSAASR
ncbi:ATP-binding cassette domain-containing protein, partial [Mesorhizobium sp. M1403]|uniref:ATP-binding cassette domain-containing protein n=1 Tax=Mesorhizobium sp. M1403 TaxID=2957097 RepID=UPI00333A42A5